MTQAQALEIMHSGANVFLTGPPGSGKTYVLNEFIGNSLHDGMHLAITASTGIAASHIGGTTIHSWSGIGITEAVSAQDLRKAENNKPLCKRLRKADILVIDEVSMLHGHRLDMVNVVLQHIRENKRPFGGLQVILVGDLFQLPPVTRRNEDNTLGLELDTGFDFVHKSSAWAQLQLRVCYLTEQHRQAADDKLLDFLLRMRSGDLPEAYLDIIKARVAVKGGTPENITRLYSHNADVDAINWAHLDKLPGKAYRYRMVTGGDHYRSEALKRNILAPEQLELKVGAEVMFVANNFQEGWFNGTRGTVTKFKDGKPIVHIHDGRRIKVVPHEWTIKEDDRVIASVEQIPLRLAWAITIHKSQGMSLDAAEVDLSKAFTPGMGYVALSRVRSLDGLYLSGYNDMALQMHEEMFAFDKLLREASA